VDRIIAAILAAMAALTYYYHLHENDDQQEETGTPNPVARLVPNELPPGEPLRSLGASATARFALPVPKA
jgi:hypothetical protein